MSNCAGNWRFLLLAMNRRDESEKEFTALLELAPDDPLGCAQLGFLLLQKKQPDRAMVLLEKVLAGPDAELANRVRAVLRIPQIGPAGTKCRARQSGGQRVRRA